MPPFHVDDLYDYLNWFEHCLSYLGGVLHTEDGHLDVQFLGEPAVLLVLERHRLEFHNGAYLDFHLRVTDGFEARDYGFHFARADDTVVWRLDKHALPESPLAPVPHIHQPPDLSAHIPHPEVEVHEVVRRIIDSGELHWDWA